MGNPISGRMADAVGPNPADRLRESSDSFGVVRFEKLLPGKWTVTVEAPMGGKPAPIAVEVAPAQALAQTLKLDERL